MESRDLDSDSKMVTERIQTEQLPSADLPDRSSISDRDTLERPERPRDTNDIPEKPSNDLNSIRDALPDRIRD